MHVGCIDSTAIDYASSALLPAVCRYELLGCTLVAALNYNPMATADDGSCAWGGCTDSTRENFNPTATVESGRCTPRWPGCRVPTAINYHVLYNELLLDSCITPGCTDSTSLFFVPFATMSFPGACASRRSLQESGSCCSLPGAANYDATCSRADACTDDFDCCSFPIQGCMDSRARNYLSAAEEDNGGCTYPIAGCTVASGTTNFDSLAAVLEGCVYNVQGCMDSSASNYAVAANVGSECRYDVHGCTMPDALNYDSLATVAADCRATVPGCTDSLADNFAPDANLASAEILMAVRVTEAQYVDSLDELERSGEVRHLT